MAKLKTDTRRGNRLNSLKNLAMILAEQIDNIKAEGVEGSSIQLLSQLSKQYRDTLREIDEIEGVDKGDDEISDILAERKTDGKSISVR